MMIGSGFEPLTLRICPLIYPIDKNAVGYLEINR